MSRFQISVLLILSTIALIVLSVTGILAYRLLSVEPVQIQAPGPTSTPIVLNFMGQGDKVLFFEAPASGAGLVGLAHKGQRNFIVNLLTDQGDFVDLLVNRIGPYEGEKALTIDQGRYMLEITADGPWAVVILPPQHY